MVAYMFAIYILTTCAHVVGLHGFIVLVAWNPTFEPSCAVLVALAKFWATCLYFLARGFANFILQLTACSLWLLLFASGQFLLECMCEWACLQACSHYLTTKPLYHFMWASCYGFLTLIAGTYISTSKHTFSVCQPDVWEHNVHIFEPMSKQYHYILD